MMQKLHLFLLILAGCGIGLALSFASLPAPFHFPQAASTVPVPVPPVLKATITPGAEVLSQFSTPDEARAWIRSHMKEGDVPHQRNPTSGTTVLQSPAPAAGTHTWQYVVDTSTFKPDEYIVQVSAVVQDATGTALFTLHDPSERVTRKLVSSRQPIPSGNGSFITVNTLGDYYVGDRITITGQTNLASDDEVLVQVYSSSFKPTQKSQSGEFSGVTGTTRLSSSPASSPSQEPAGSLAVPQAGTQDTTANPARDHSKTNVQVKDVDEADIVKTDGTYIYAVTGNHLHIIRGFPADSAGIIATLQFSGKPENLYLNGDRLVLISSAQRMDDFRRCRPGSCSFAIPSLQKTEVFVYTVSDPARPVLVRQLELDGAYRESRMIGTELYFVTNGYFDPDDESAGFPVVTDSAAGSLVPPVYYFSTTDREYGLTTIGAVDTASGTGVKAKSFLIGSAGTVYVSMENLYIAIPADTSTGTSPSTELYSFSLDQGALNYRARGSIGGTLLNQYSLDEYGETLRVATTIMDPVGSGRGRSSQVTVLDRHLRILGTLDGLAPTQKIYAARFMGDRLYLVTYRETDPLFVIDLADPARPKVLGELHIPGFSSYLHPYDATHLIGIGKETTRGPLKIALFNVSDVHNPVVIDTEYLGGFGSDSAVLRDPHAFLFDREKDLLVLPVRILERKNAPGYEELIWGGAYVFGVSPATGFAERGTVIHYQGSGNGREVLRAFFIEDVLYTMGSDKIVMSDLKNNVALLGTVGLP